MQIDNKFMQDILCDIRMASEYEMKLNLLEKELVEILKENKFMIPTKEIERVIRCYFNNYELDEFAEQEKITINEVIKNVE